MADQDMLLTDTQVQQFIVDGYINLNADYPASFHKGVHDQIEEIFEKEGNVGNNILPRLPAIRQVFDHPAVSGALTSLLGPEYILNPHRHCHLNPPGSKGQGWHKDCYVYDHNIRHPRFHWVLAFYYPQDTTEDMGASGIIPGTQFRKSLSNPDPAQTEESGLSVCGPAGTVCLIHFDSWHRATPNVSAKKRYMLKFQFARMHEPAKPTWNISSKKWTPPESDPNPAVSLDVWNWLCGQSGERTGDTSDTSTSLELLKDPSESVRLNAAYALAAQGESAVQTLVEQMIEETKAAVDETTATTADNAHGTNPTAGVCARALSTMGECAIPALLEAARNKDWWVRAMAVDMLTKMGPVAKSAVPALTSGLDDEHWWVRRNCAEGLKAMNEFPETVVNALTKAVSDPDYRVRRNAALAITDVGPDAEGAIPNLLEMLDDENRYNRFYAATALKGIGTQKANSALLDNLFTARWCPITTPESTF
jgi:hypothetical protein